MLTKGECRSSGDELLEIELRRYVNTRTRDFTLNLCAIGSPGSASAINNYHVPRVLYRARSLRPLPPLVRLSLPYFIASQKLRSN